MRIHKKIWYVILLLCLSAGAYSCKQQKQKEWVKVNSPNGKCSVMMPAEPNMSKDSMISKTDVHAHMQILLLTSNDEQDSCYTYALAEIQYDSVTKAGFTPIILQRIFDNMQSAIARKFHGKIYDSKDFTYKNYAGRKFQVKLEISNKPCLAIIQCYLIEDAMYILQVVSSPDKFHNQNLIRFFDSFSYPAAS